MMEKEAARRTQQTDDRQTERVARPGAGFDVAEHLKYDHRLAGA